jgi:hypothetical protein
LEVQRLIAQDPRLGPGSLYAAVPIPACKALIWAGEKAAKDVLVALVLHADGRSPYVFPSRETIEDFSGRADENLTKAIKVLVRFGFLSVTKIKVGRVYRNNYEVLRSGFHWKEFNEVASRYKWPKGACKVCRQWVFGDEWYKSRGWRNGVEVTLNLHKNCGGRIVKLTREQIKNIRDQEESAEIPFHLPG